MLKLVNEIMSLAPNPYQPNPKILIFSSKTQLINCVEGPGEVRGEK